MKPAMKSGTKEKVRPGLESFLVGLNFIGMMFLPLLAVFSGYLDDFRMHLPDSARLIALLVSFLNIGLFAKAHKDLGRNWSPILEIKDNHKLIEYGVYKRIRHPMYAHIWLWVIGQGLVLDNWVVWAFGVAAWATLYYIRVPREEAMLIDEFGDKYKKYMRRTGAIFPKFDFGRSYEEQGK